jgi:hypothetical protein
VDLYVGCHYRVPIHTDGTEDDPVALTGDDGEDPVALTRDDGNTTEASKDGDDTKVPDDKETAVPPKEDSPNNDNRFAFPVSIDAAPFNTSEPTGVLARVREDNADYIVYTKELGAFLF